MEEQKEHGRLRSRNTEKAEDRERKTGRSLRVCRYSKFKVYNKRRGDLTNDFFLSFVLASKYYFVISILIFHFHLCPLSPLTDIIWSLRLFDYRFVVNDVLLLIPFCFTTTLLSQRNILLKTPYP